MQSTQEPEPPTSATRQVWAVPELVGMILSHLEPREIMVCKRIDRFTQEVINNNVNLEVGKKIWTRPTGTHRKAWLFEPIRWAGGIEEVPLTVKYVGRYSVYEPVVANPLLLDTTADQKMALSREGFIKTTKGKGKSDIPDRYVLTEWLWTVRPEHHSWAMAAMPRSASTLQDPLWLEGKSSTANMQLFDPPIYGTVKATSRSWDGKIRIEVVPTHGSDTSITWGAVGKAYKRVVDRYTKAQFNKHGIVYNHAETKTPIDMEIRLPRTHTLLPQDLYWWFRDLLQHYHRFDAQSFVDRMGSINDTFEIANAGYNVPSAVPPAFKKYMEQAKEEDRKILGKLN